MAPTFGARGSKGFSCMVIQHSGFNGRGSKKLLSLSYPITRRQILDSSKLKEFADGNFKSDENGRKLSKWVLLKTLWEKEKLLVMSNFSFFHSVFKRLVSQGRQKVSLCGNVLSSAIACKSSLKNRDKW